METEAELIKASAEISREVDQNRQGKPVVLLVNGHRYAELVKKEGDEVTVAYPNQYTTRSLSALEAEGYKAVPAKRVIKANGTEMYAVVTDAGTDWYIGGKRYPAVRKKA